MTRGTHKLKLLWSVRGSGRRILKEITQARTLSEKHKEQQIEELKHTLISNERKNSKLLDNSSYLDPSIYAPKFNAFRFVPLNTTNALYTKCASNGRPYQVWLYNHDCHTHSMIFEESQSSCTVDVALTRDRKYITLNSNTRISSEVSIVKSHDLVQRPCDLSQLPILLRPRQDYVEYYVEHAHNQFYVFTNLGQETEYKLMVANSSTPGTWMDYYQPQNGLVLQDVEFFNRAILLYGIKELVPVVVAIDPFDRDKDPVVLSGDEFTYIDKMGIEAEGLESLHDYHSNSWPVWLSSPASPPSLFTISRENKKMATRVPDKGSNTEKYCIERVCATSKDGVQVPMTLCYHRDLVKKDNKNPVLVHVYGSYGENVYTGYQPEKVPLLDRGWVLVYCHVRGGGEKGRHWYYGGSGKNKHNTFEDLLACVRELHTGLSLSQPRLTAMTGRSAGGLAVGMFCNLWPHLLQAAILQVPLVNVIDCLSDPSLYLSSKDYIEFGGDPLSSEAERQHITSICPYSSLRPWDYPAMLISASVHDDVIPFDGVEKYVSKLKDCVSIHQKKSRKFSFRSYARRSGVSTCLPSQWRTIDRGMVLFSVDAQHGHYGSGDWELKACEASLQAAFLHKALQLELA